MKAIVYERYGSPDVLEVREIERPVVDDDSVLIRVRAAAVNPLDWHFMRGLPYLVRMEAGLRKPKNPRLGVDLAGQIEEVGKNVTEFRPGDEVFGARTGAFAEYVTTKGKALALKPAQLTFEQAAAVPVAGFTALQGLRDKGNLQPGQRVLINGAAGGVGTFAVQIARALGAEVTGVCSTRNVEMVRSIGAQQVIDYTRENFTRMQTRYDLIFDCVGNHSLTDFRRVLTQDGTYLVVGGPSDNSLLGPLAGMFQVLVLDRFVSQRLLMFMSNTNKADLVTLKELIEAGKITPVIDRCYPLTQVPEAIRYLEEGHARGKVVISVA